MLALAWLSLCAVAWPTPAVRASTSVWPPLRLAAETVTVGAISVTGLEVELRSDGELTARFERVAGADGETVLAATGLGGRLDELDNVGDTTTASGRVRAWGLDGGWTLQAAAAGIALEFAVSDQSLPVLAGLPGAPDELRWLQGGRFDATALLDWPAERAAAWRAVMSADDVGFDSPDGRFAGQGLAFEIRGEGDELELAGAGIRARMTHGELLLDRLYRRFDEAPVDFELASAGAADPTVLTLRLNDPGAVRLDATVEWPGTESAGPSIDVKALDLAFPGAYQRYLESIAAAWDLDGLEVTGRVAWQGAWRNGELESGDLDIFDLSVVDSRRQRFALTGFQTRLKPGDRAFESRLSWRGLLLGKLNLGDGVAILDAEPGLLSLKEPLLLELFGGELRLDALRYALPGARTEAGRDTFVSASLRGIELELLTQALGWPVFGGTLNGELPGAHLEDGVLSVDGGIGVEVFDGAVAITDLRIERLFGVLPSLAANVELRNLDLERLTDTFSFGRIGGRVDGHVHDLRMLDWRPVAFDAWLGTPENQRGTQGISRQAVNHLTSIGGGGATAALSGPMLRFFNNFSYRRIGLGCRLDNYVCEIRGLDDDGSGVLLLEGAGVPRITIRAYNRAIDWPQMLANLAAISAGESIEIGAGSNP